MGALNYPCSTFTLKLGHYRAPPAARRAAPRGTRLPPSGAHGAQVAVDPLDHVLRAVPHLAAHGVETHRGAPIERLEPGGAVGVPEHLARERPAKLGSLLRVERSHGAGNLHGQISTLIRQQMYLSEFEFRDALRCPLTQDHTFDYSVKSEKSTLRFVDGLGVRRLFLETPEPLRRVSAPPSTEARRSLADFCEYLPDGSRQPCYAPASLVLVRPGGQTVRFSCAEHREAWATRIRGRYLVLERDEWEGRGAGYCGPMLGSWRGPRQPAIAPLASAGPRHSFSLDRPRLP